MTKIEWANETWNPVTGCTPISAGCKNCYAARMAKRLAGRYGYPKDDPFSVTMHPDRLHIPGDWKKPRRIFVCSMGDIFHERVEWNWLFSIFQIAASLKRHTFLFLTKRPHNAYKFLAGDGGFHLQRQGLGNWPFENIWIGVTAENQKAAAERIPVFLQTPAAVRFVSVEPMLSPVDISHWTDSTRNNDQSQKWDKGRQPPCEFRTNEPFRTNNPCYRNFKETPVVETSVGRKKPHGKIEEFTNCKNQKNLFTGENNNVGAFQPLQCEYPNDIGLCKGEKKEGTGRPNSGLHAHEAKSQATTGYQGPIRLVICGAETGPKARHMELEWAIDLKNQCREAGIPFFFKKASKGDTVPDELNVREFPKEAK